MIRLRVAGPVCFCIGLGGTTACGTQPAGAPELDAGRDDVVNDAGSGGSASGLDAGAPWVKRESGVLANLFAVTFADGQFVAVGSNSIVTSRDGISWTPRSIPVSAELRAVLFGNGRFVAVGSKAAILTSEDALQWTERKVPLTGADDALASVVYGNGMFIASSGRLDYWTSADGIGWKNKAVNGAAPGSGIFKVAYGVGQFVGISPLANGITSAPRSADGVTWQWSAVGLEKGTALAYGAAQWVAVGESGGVHSSPRGDEWSQRVSNRPGGNSSYDALYDVTYSEAGFVAVGVSDGAALIRRSLDASTWDRGSAPCSLLRGVTSGKGQVVAVGADGCVVTKALQP